MSSEGGGLQRRGKSESSKLYLLPKALKKFCKGGREKPERERNSQVFMGKGGETDGRNCSKK